MVIRQGVEEGMEIRTARQAEQANVGVQAIPTSLRSLGVGVTEGNYTTDTRAVRAATTGSLAGDLFLETDTGWTYRWTGTAWAYVSGMYAASDATRAALTISAADNGAWFFNTDTDTDMGLWQVSGGAWVKRFPDASIDLLTSYKVGGVKVLGSPSAAVADAAGGAVIDVEARAAINALLARARAQGWLLT